MTPLLRWIASSAADAVGRLLLQVLATALFARWLAPEAFGEAALTAVAVGLLSVFVTAPFEEALSQRRRVRRRHFEASLAVVLMAAAVLSGVAFALSASIPAMTSIDPDAAQRAAIYSLVLFAEGPIAVLTAICRRHRHFGELALANLIGQFVGTGVGIALVWNGAGVAGLLSVRFMSRIVTALILILRSRVRIVPRPSRASLRDLSGFAGWHLAGRVVESVSDASFQFLVTLNFGLSAGGYLNMALRIVEPLRGAAGAIGHNIATSFFARTQDSPSRFQAAVSSTISESTLLLMPVFVGIAAASPSILAVLAGPQWQPSIPLAVCVALAAAVGTVTNFMHSAVAARGRADLGFAAGALDLLVTVAVLVAGQPFGLVAVGLARLLPYLVDAVFISIVAERVVQLPMAPIARSLARIIASNAVMAGSVVLLGWYWPWQSGPPVQLLAEIVTGIAVYFVLCSFRHPALLGSLRQRLLR